MSSMLISRKCKTENTQSDSFQNIMTDVKAYNAESGPEKKKESSFNIEQNISVPLFSSIYLFV